MTQTATTLNVPHMLQQQVRHVSALVAECLSEGISAIDATPEAVADWQSIIDEKNALRQAFIDKCTPSYLNVIDKCTPSYLNAEGRGPSDRRSALASGVYHPSYEFWELLDSWREDHQYRGLRVDH
jgi:hypothetical protein